MSADIYGHDTLARFSAELSDDCDDLQLTCYECGEVVCNVEAGDSLSSLAGAADSHECGDELPCYCGRQDCQRCGLA